MRMSLFKQRIVLSWIILASLLLTTPLQAKDAKETVAEPMPTVNTALTTLFGDAAPALVRPIVVAGVQAPNTQPVALEDRLMSPTRVVVKRGDTVDGLLRKHLGESAFSQKFLRQAVVRLNPAAFPQGNIHRLEPGATLLLPSEQTLVGLLAKKSSGAVSIPLDPMQDRSSIEAVTPGAAADSTQSARKHWVRYP